MAMSGPELALVASVFLACAVEAVEALTVVLAVGTTRSWPSGVYGGGRGCGDRRGGARRAGRQGATGARTREHDEVLGRRDADLFRHLLGNAGRRRFMAR